MLGANAAGGAVCITATLIDGFVLARSGFNHSMNYRSAMCFGIPTEITDPVAKSAALGVIPLVMQADTPVAAPDYGATLAPPRLAGLNARASRRREV
jgi:nitroimidazol reductase NimA-like FMN-containing flavoprotein (pyridoxamine 5'-phosphate oxidase superfamily)